nr:hypothetical protein [Saprospiraceae bacterium]
MKIGIIFCLSMMLLIPYDLFTQNINREIREASRELTRFNLDPLQNKANLIEAKKIIEGVIQMKEAETNFRAWQTRGEIYNSSLTAEITMITLEGKEGFENPEDGVIAYQSFERAISLAEKRHEERDALAGITEAAGHLGNIGSMFIEKQDYAAAFQPLNLVYKIHNILIEKGEDPIFENEEELNNHLYILGVCGLQAGETDLAEKYMLHLYEKRYDESRVYVTLFNMYVEDNEEKALEILETGKKVSPEDIDILYAEINYYIAKNDFKNLQEKLTVAIEKDPENHTLYNVLGNVFMNLMTEAMENEEEEDVIQKYFETSLKYLEEAIELEPTFFEPYYTIGSIYFNRAAILTQRMNELTMSREDQKLYEQYTKEANELFNKALPYFKKAESLEPNDITTLIALRETFARMQDFELYNVFNERLEKIESGEKLESSYFNFKE